jgi:hypothetical protein
MIQEIGEEKMNIFNSRIVRWIIAVPLALIVSYVVLFLIGVMWLTCDMYVFHTTFPSMFAASVSSKLTFLATLVLLVVFYKKIQTPTLNQSH